MNRSLTIVACTLVAILVTAFTPLSYDTGWLLDYGRTVVRDGWLPGVNGRSFLEPDQPQIMHEWLTAVAMYAAVELGGVPLLIGLRWLGIFLTVAVVGRLVAKESDAPAVRLVVLLVFGICLMPGVQLLRPQLVTLVALAWVVHAAVVGQRYSRWSLPLVFAGWAAMHGGWLAGLGLLPLLLLARRMEGDAGIGWAEIVVLPLLCALALLTNPWGPELLTHSWHHATDAGRMINLEWRPLIGRGQPLYPFEWVAIGGMSLVLLLALLGLPRRRWTLWLLLFVGVAVGLAGSRHLRLTPILLAPVAAAAVHNLVPGRLRLRMDRLAGALGLGIAGLAGAILGFSGADLARFHDYSGPNPGAVIHAMQRADVKGEVWNDVNWGGHMLWLLPEIRVACDGRNVAAYSPQGMRHCLSLGAAQHPDQVLDKAGADHLVLMGDHPALQRLGGAWTEVLCAQGACWFTRDGRMLDRLEEQAPDAPLLGVRDLYEVRLR